MVEEKLSDFSLDYMTTLNIFLSVPIQITMIILIIVFIL